ncbi:MAG: beta-propeller domain-containing protein [Acidimicrobiales bacterium]
MVLAAGITAVALVAGSSSPAAAAGLARFSSCAELEGWTEDISSAPVPTTAVFAEADEAVAEDAGRVPSAAPGVAGGEQLAQLEATADGDTGGTNTVVAGVDEIDIIDRVGEDRLLVSRNGALALVDLAGRVVVAELADVPYDARISVAGDTVWVAGSSPDGIGTLVRRVRLQGDALVDDGSWSTPGWLLDARRTGDRLHVVAVDQPYDTGVIPFEGGSVPCEEMWHPTEPATTPAATLVASLPAEGALEPTATAAVTGSAGNLLVTDDSVYLATETWSPDDGQVSTGLHRFDLATLTPTGSGSVPGAVAGRFAMDEHDGHLRVATSEPSFEPIALDGGGIGGRPASGDDVMIAPALPAEPETTVPETTVPETTTSTTAVDPTTTGPEPPLTTIAPETTVVTPEPPVPPDVEAALAEVFVLDTDGDLDIVGRTGRFGHDFETIQGVRFVGDVAYVVTFLQTDPFWVIDLADPANPTVVGELAIPGFSAYLHPLADGRVVGFGPDGAGSVSARLFDVTDPTNPAVLDEIALGDDSPIVWDAHAYVTLDGDRFAVPVSDWPDVSGCVDVPVPERPTPEPLPDIPPIEPDGSSICEPVLSGGLSGAVVLGLANDRLVEVERASVETDGSVSAERVVLAPDGTWLLLSWDRLVPTDGADHIQLPVGPNTGGVVIED